LKNVTFTRCEIDDAQTIDNDKPDEEAKASDLVFSDGASEIGERSIGVEDYSLTIDLNAQLKPKLVQID
jgi:hypothetical protein